MRGWSGAAAWFGGVVGGCEMNRLPLMSTLAPCTVKWCEPGDAHEVVGGHDQVARQFGACHATEARATEATDRLHPAEDLLDALTKPLAQAVADVPRGATVNRTASTAGVLRHVWRDAALPELRHA